MTEYELKVSAAFKLRSSLPFTNDSPDDARVVIKHLVLNADKEVCLYSDNLSPSVDGVEVYDWQELCDATKTFLKKSNNSKLKIKVSSNESDCSSSGLTHLASQFKEQVSISYGITRRGPNFAINDTGGYRFEQDGTAKALVCANDFEYSKELRSIFQNKLTLPEVS